jgi:predicted metal-dependent HD superfamily phosphohydrolase
VIRFELQEIIGLQKQPISASDIREVRLDRMPPEVVTHGGQVCFVSATLRPWLSLFCRANAVPLVNRVDVWSELAEPFLDTEFSNDQAAATLARLATCGLDEESVARIRASIGKTMLSMTAVTWEWCHYGHMDVLTAMKTTLSRTAFKSFARESMQISAMGSEQPPWNRPLTERMRGAWSDLTSKLGIPFGQGDAVGAQLVTAYADADRHYHNLAHVQMVLERVSALAAKSADRPALEAAAWFHDAIYNPQSTTNEADSAALMRSLLAPLGVEPNLLDRIASFIERTAKPSGAVDASERALMDADFSILGETTEVYGAYAADVRQEYHHLSDDQFRQGRADFLRRLAERSGALFFDLPPICEVLAAQNIARELRVLTQTTL